jgi:hypothetical protein
MKNQFNNLFWQKSLQYALIFLSSVLVCIWAMQHTIALRNGLLALGTIAGLFYCYIFFKPSKGPHSFKKFAPLIMLGLVFAWVLVHFFFLSEDPVLQYQELKSTWLRTLLSTIMGFATGLAISKRPSLLQCLWLGLFAATIALYAQYIPRAWQAHALFQPDYLNYIFYGKHNFVMVGTLLIAGILGAMGDQLSGRLSFQSIHNTRHQPQKTALYKILNDNRYWLIVATQVFALAVVLFAYVYMFDTRNGIGLAVLLLLIATTFVFLPILIGKRGVASGMTNEAASLPFNKVVSLALLVSVIALVMYFSYRQAQVNAGWINAIEDAKIAVQIDRYPNWQNPVVMGYPKTESGRQVTINNYERMAWGTAAARMIIEDPLGNGILHYSFKRALEKRYPNIATNPNYASASHSAWLELGLTLGLPGLCLLVGALLLLLRRYWNSHAPLAKTGLMLSAALLLLYVVAELIGQHGLESLFSWIALLTGLQFRTASQEEGR